MSNNLNETDTANHGLPSVNDRSGAASRSVRGKVISMAILAGILACIVGASYYAMVRIKHGMAGHQPKTDEAMLPTNKARKFDIDAAPPLPASLAASSPVAASAPVTSGPVAVKPTGATSRSGGQPAKVVNRYDSGILLDDDDAAVRATPASFGARDGAVGGSQGGLSGLMGGSDKAGGTGALSGLLTATSTPLAEASKLGNLSLIMAKTTPMLCGLRGAIDSGRAGQTSCIVTKDMLSADGKVILVDRGSVVDLEYGPVTKQGVKSVGVLASRIRTPLGVVIDVASLATDELGRSGAPGYVDNHWGERIGAALLLAIIQDGVSYATTKAQSGSGGTTIYQNTSDAGDKMSEKVLDSTINIPPSVLINQGDQISIELSRDLDFSHVYSLEPN